MLEGGGSRWRRHSPASLWKEEEGAEWAEQADGVAGPTGPEVEKNPFGIKLGFLNLQRIWKFVQGDLGEILIWGFFLNSSRLLKDFRKI
jgi:hypothetical protein